MIPMPVFVSAPWELGAWLREDLYERLRFMGIDPVSSWAYAADGAPEDLHAVDDATKLAACETNDRDLHRSDLLLLVTRKGRGSASFAEARYALAIGRPVVWVGPRYNLDAWRPGVLRVDDVDAALVRLVEARVRWEHGRRGWGLIEVVP